MRTLLVDDDPAYRRLACMALEEAGVAHVAVSTPTQALELLSGDSGSDFDLVLLDHELPGMSGPELLKRLRAEGRDVPVVVVTVRDDVDERIRALHAGADDYVVKPMSFTELVARLRAVVRRSRGVRPIRIGSLEIDPLLRSVRRGGEPLELTKLEFELLFVLALSQERTVSRKELLRRVWSMYFQPGTNFVQVHMSRLRSKLGDLADVDIQTIRGRGYRLVARPREVAGTGDLHGQPQSALPATPGGKSPSAEAAR
jgi:two-component system OmpR family response regulator